MNEDLYKKKIEEVGVRFRAKCRDYSDELSQFADLMRSDGDSIDAENVKQISMLVHGIAGSAATFGHPELGQMAVDIEQHLSKIEVSRSPLQAELLVLVDRLAEHLGEVSS